MAITITSLGKAERRLILVFVARCLRDGTALRLRCNDRVRIQLLSPIPGPWIYSGWHDEPAEAFIEAWLQYERALD